MSPTKFIIDGYNVMFAMGYLSQQTTTKRFERQRQEFLNWLANQVHGRAVDILVVFDAQNSLSPSNEQMHRGIRYLFAYRESADDRIEALLSQISSPEKVAVVSNDNGVLDAAGRRRYLRFRVDDFMDWLEAQCKMTSPTAPTSAEKPLSPSAEEKDHLFREFSQPPSPNRRRRKRFRP